MKMLKRVIMGLSFAINLLFALLIVYYFATGRHMRLIHPHAIPEYVERIDLFRAMPGKGVRAVMLGDSITCRCDWAELLGDHGVVNRGINGDGVIGMCHRAGDVARIAPARIFIMAGINDLGMNRDPGEIAMDYGRLVSLLMKLTPRSRLFIQSVLPVIPGRVTVAPESIVRLNENLKRIALTQGITYIDLHGSFVDRDGNLRADLTHDGVHLNGAGYLQWKSRIVRYLR